MAWFRKDLAFCTVGSDGRYNEYSTLNFELEKERSWEAPNGTSFLSVVLAGNSPLVYGEDADTSHIYEPPSSTS